MSQTIEQLCTDWLAAKKAEQKGQRRTHRHRGANRQPYRQA